MVFGHRKRLISRLVICEDEPLVAFDHEHLLTEEGFEVVATVDTAEDAIAALNDNAEVHLVLSDISLASGTGIDIARHAHALGVAVIYVTGDCPAEGKAFARGCLAKPFRPADLLAAINAVEGQLRGQPRPRRLPTGFSLFDQEAA